MTNTEDRVLKSLQFARRDILEAMVHADDEEAKALFQAFECVQRAVAIRMGGEK